jgi:hypothetical protein
VVVVASVVVVEVVGIEVGVVAGVDEEHPTTTNDATKKPTQRMPPPYGTRKTLPMAISDKVFPTSAPPFDGKHLRRPPRSTAILG